MVYSQVKVQYFSHQTNIHNSKSYHEKFPNQFSHKISKSYWKLLRWISCMLTTCQIQDRCPILLWEIWKASSYCGYDYTRWSSKNTSVTPHYFGSSNRCGSSCLCISYFSIVVNSRQQGAIIIFKFNVTKPFWC